ncbi:hypothetical protein TVAG_271250 [Trichomonas vaginalis G3]|uniref:Uncharacterized protein n=1 Tax=Trichomonas vaginalis (strain ATCC PRA-98 / G3) TaxID=412133 RepID=A2EA94_TRIV3|nr:hypothetical protein TVAG_559260 [Trichomonas vaginalis G3]EAY10434.1 hypothetical protein TVAG_271250 [Trichomonas vaginalis G3]|eukprot:XP_001282998.1 hypothetical protein [Trichomonas vaginalis G3]
MTENTFDREALKKELREEILNELKPKEQPKEEQQEKPAKPKRKLSEKQLAALAAGRAKNPRMIAKKLREEEEAKKNNK